jgi:peptidoglycan/xylan/chitin deacetylase (PgdA/CDA1 family)
MVRPILKLASPGGKRGRLSVLVLHRVLAEADALFPEAMDIPRFTELCRWLDSLFHVVPLDEGARLLKDGGLPERALAITFDDGYADNHDVALPILRRHGLPATFFIATGFLGRGCMWNDLVIEAFRHTKLQRADLSDLLGSGAYSLADPQGRRSALEDVIGKVKYLQPERRLDLVGRIGARLEVDPPPGMMMTTDEVVALRKAGMQIGAHTVSHPILATLDAAEKRREIGESKRVLEAVLGERVDLFAYPNGKPGEDFDADSVLAVREAGFAAAVTTARGAANPRADVFQIPRFTPWDRTRLRFGVRMLSTLWASRHHVPKPGEVAY